MPASPGLLPAAQYLRMSTDMQECSIENQAIVIQRYAAANGFEVVKTYEDAGRSGLTLNERRGLKSLLSDVLHRKTTFRAVLVYDVSRWGRFQDADEAAHYEFLCKSSGVKVHYCAEQFGPEETLSSRMMKALKRTMAAEFSRELSQKVFIGKRRFAEMGFHQGAAPGYGLRRVLVGTDGAVKQVLRPGEYKYISSDHVLLAPGPKRERKWVRWIFEQRINGLQICDIVKELNLLKVPWIDGKQWNRYAVRQILTNPKYLGCSCWAQRSQTLHTKARLNPRNEWVVVEGAFKGIVDRATFDHAHRVIKQRMNYKTNEAVLRELKALWKRRGTLSESIINSARGVPAVAGLRGRFGSMAKVYKLLGFKPDPIHDIRTAKVKMTLRLREKIFVSLRQSFPYEATFTRPNSRHGYSVSFADVGRVAVVLCRSYERPDGFRYWPLYVRANTRGLPALVCLLSRDNNSIEAYYAMPKIDAASRLTLTVKDPWFQGGIRLDSIAELRSALVEMKKRASFAKVYRGFPNLDTQVMGRASRSHVHYLESTQAAARLSKPRRT